MGVVAALILTALAVVFAPDVHAVALSRTALPDWVDVIEPELDVAAPTAEVEYGSYYLLADYQTRFAADHRTAFRHFAAKALNDKGVDGLANIEIDFDPAYQTLELHRLQLIRKGQVISQLQSIDVKLLQRESDLESRIIDGRQTATMFLADVRAGDIVEYAYSIKGSNPVFAGREFGGLPLAWNQPVHRLNLRLSVQRNRKLNPKPINSELQPTVTQQGEFRDYRWALKNVAAVKVDADAPSWYSPYASVQWSEFDNWNAVARWAAPLYAVDGTRDEPLNRLVRDIAGASSEPEQRLLHALRIVQRDVRYLGIEVGAGSHAPRAPSQVYRQRFGDCKDKTRLLLSLLHGLGIKAHAALVSTDRLLADDLRPPSPGAFNHVIVRADIGGKGYWLDPTRPMQSAPLNRLFQPDFGQALIIDTQQSGLVTMNPEQQNRRVVHVRLDNLAGFDAPVTMSVETQYFGAAAEQMRDRIAGTSLDELSKQFVTYYEKYYRGLRSVAAVAVADLPENNQLNVVERYEIPQFWPTSAKGDRREAQVEMPDILDYLGVPSISGRTSPVAQHHPLDVELTTELLLPEPWPFESEAAEVQDPHFAFSHKLEGDASHFIFKHSYRSLRDHIPAAEAATFVENIERARALVGYQLSFATETSDAPMSWTERFNWQVAMIAGLLVIVYTWLALKLYRYDPPINPSLVDPKLAGIGGWLVLPALGVMLNPLLLGYTMYDASSAYDLQTWTTLTQPGGEFYRAAWAPILLFELAADMALLMLSLVLLLLFFKKRSSTPRFYLAMLIATPLLLTIKMLMLGSQDLPPEQIDIDWGDVAKSVIQLMIWGSYFMLSRRVRSTFTRRLARPVENPPALQSSAESVA